MSSALIPSDESMLWNPPPKPMLTPCVGICLLDRDGYCEGCFRSLDEIARWATMSDAERARIMRDVLPGREAARA